MRTFWAAVLVASAVGMTAIAAPPARAAPTSADGPVAMPDLPDVEARNLFQAGRYPDALAIYRRLYAETNHPTYLRNIGRCHQMMREPTPAIESFRAYLHEAHSLDEGERAEIEGYIAEMQRLQVAAPPAAGSSGTAVASSASPSGATPGGGAITRRWWFWTGLGALAVTGVIAIVAASGGKDRLPCPGGAVCPP